MKAPAVGEAAGIVRGHQLGPVARVADIFGADLRYGHFATQHVAHIGIGRQALLIGDEAVRKAGGKPSPLLPAAILPYPEADERVLRLAAALPLLREPAAVVQLEDALREQVAYQAALAHIGEPRLYHGMRVRGLAPARQRIHIEAVG